MPLSPSNAGQSKSNEQIMSEVKSQVDQLSAKPEVVYVTGNYAAEKAGEYLTHPSSIHLEIHVNTGGEARTYEAGPYKWSVLRGLRLTTQYQSPHPHPVFAREVQLPDGMTPAQFRSNLLINIDRYNDSLPYNFPLLGPGIMMWGWNSNSWAAGMLKYSTGRDYPSIGNAIRESGFIAPGFEKPIPIR